MKQHPTIIFLLCLLTGSLRAAAQHEEPVVLNVRYLFVHMSDTNNRASPVKTLMNLHLGKTNSKYISSATDNATDPKKTEADNEPPGPAIVVTGRPMAIVSNPGNDVLFQIPMEKKLIRTSNLGIAEYRMESPLPKIDWRIEPETKTIEGYRCQKAIGQLSGRTYTAWFTGELPFEMGPWKLSGLPGLILEARDSKDEVLFICQEITKGEAGQRIFSNQRRPVKVDEAVFERAKKNFNEDPSGVMQSQIKDYTDPIPTYYRDASGKLLRGGEAKSAIKNEKKINNNPVELPQ